MDATSTAEPFRFAPAAATVVGGAASATAGTESRDRRPSAEGIVDQTRREIASIVRETALLARRPQTPAAFFAALVDRVMRAMAAEGVVVWRRESGVGEPTFAPVARVGRITDRTIRPEQAGCHQRMLCEVATGNQPTVVPPSPDACDAALPTNPTPVPAAVVPVAEVDRCDFLLEVFLEPAGGLATQRGYLRFAAQMADLAGEFLRLHRIRQADQAQQRWQRLAALLPTMHRSLEEATAMAAVVDGAAEALPADRVSICRVRGGRARVLAVSHVPRIDAGSAAAQHVARLALQCDPGRPWFPSAADPGSSDPATRPAGDAIAGDAIAGDPAAVDPLAGDPAVPKFARGTARVAPVEAAPPDDAPLCCEAVLPLDDDGHYRLVVQSIDLPDGDQGRRDDMLMLASHARHALQNARTFGSIPWGRAAAALAPASFAMHHRSRGRWITAAVVVALLVSVGLLPVPLVVRATGELRPAHSSYVYAPRAGIVTEVLVEHGTPVRRGDLLVRMIDRDLEQQYETLLGRRAVLEQRAAELSSALVDRSLRGQRDDSQQLQADQRVIDQERLAIDQQLSLLQRERQMLDLRSDRDGVIDGWQLRRQWTGRPVARGQMLLCVIDPAGPWDVEALVPQSRLDHVINPVDARTPDGDPHRQPTATVVLQACPDLPLTAALQSVGPALVSADGDAPAGRAMLRITSRDLPALQTGAPAEVAIACGTRSLAYVAFQDLIRAVRGSWGLYCSS